MRGRHFVTTSAFGLLVGAMAVIAFNAAPLVLDFLCLAGQHLEVAGIAFGLGWLVSRYRRTSTQSRAIPRCLDLPQARAIRY